MPPPVINGIIPSTIDISPINHSYWTYKTNLANYGAPPCKDMSNNQLTRVDQLCYGCYGRLNKAVDLGWVFWLLFRCQMSISASNTALKLEEWQTSRFNLALKWAICMASLKHKHWLKSSHAPKKAGSFPAETKKSSSVGESHLDCIYPKDLPESTVSLLGC